MIAIAALGFFFQAEDGIRDSSVTGVQTCALPISPQRRARSFWRPSLPRGHYPNDCVDEGTGAASACGEPHRRTGADDGGAPSRASIADRTSQARALASHCFLLSSSQPLSPPPPLLTIPSHLRHPA